ncbi:MAG: tail fiber protein [Rhodanobacteraceae bacterium]|nr:tail fiber protein [Rhodanobacteraceae bacterium]
MRWAAALVSRTRVISLLGTTYGGNGKSNFALPDLRGRAPRTGARARLVPHDLGETGVRDRYAASRAMRRTSTGERERRIRRMRRRRQVLTGARIGTCHLSRLRGATLVLMSTSTTLRRRRPAAQQHDARTDLLFLHRAARRVSAAHLRTVPCNVDHS